MAAVVSQPTVITADHAIRRVVSGHDAAGEANVESDGPARNVRVREGAGFISTLMWATEETTALGSRRIDRAHRTIGTASPPTARL
jgi:hypothetical protein